MLDETQLKKIIAGYQDPFLQTDYVSSKALQRIEIKLDRIQIEINLGYPIADIQNELIAAFKKFLLQHITNKDITIFLNTAIVAHAVQQPHLKTIVNIKNIIAVASGKGGVGKSTTAVNLAIALQQAGANVGILDADIYGPNQPHMLGVKKTPETKTKKFVPVMSHGIQSMSIGYLIDVNAPMIWRGPMVSQALQQLINDTEWQPLDYLIIDLPPGTGDIQLTLAQKVPVNGAVIVTTPQDIALLDARKAIEMFKKVNIAVLGVIENMSIHICNQCGHAEKIFGEAGAARLAQATEAELLGALPLDIKIREQADKGTPIVSAAPNTEIANLYRNIARRVAAKLSLQAKNYSAKFPPIVVENK